MRKPRTGHGREHRDEQWLREAISMASGRRPRSARVCRTGDERGLRESLAARPLPARAAGRTADPGGPSNTRTGHSDGIADVPKDRPELHAHRRGARGEPPRPARGLPDASSAAASRRRWAPGLRTRCRTRCSAPATRSRAPWANIRLEGTRNEVRKSSPGGGRGRVRRRAGRQFCAACTHRAGSPQLVP